MRRILILASVLFALPSFAMAQHHGGMAAGSPTVVAAPRAMASAPRAMASAPVSIQRGVARVSAAPRVAAMPVGVGHLRVNGTINGTVNRNVSIASGLRNLPLFRTDSANVPGLGFDFPHLAAVNSGQGSGRMRRRFDQDVTFGFGGFLLMSPSVIVMEGEPAQSQPAAEENATANAAGAENVRDLEDQFLPSPGPASAPPRDAAEYVFVRRDGSLLFAVAYSWDRGTLRYVTRDGLRRSVSQDALDMDATQQFNEQRGLNFRLPA